MIGDWIINLANIRESTADASDLASLNLQAVVDEGECANYRVISLKLLASALC